MTWYLTLQSISKEWNRFVWRQLGMETVWQRIYLAAKADGTKLKSFVVFHGAKRTWWLDEEFKSRCVVKSSGNAWMNKELTIIWVKLVLGVFSFNRLILSWDSYECHMTNGVRKYLKEMNVGSVIAQNMWVHKIYSSIWCVLE